MEKNHRVAQNDGAQVIVRVGAQARHRDNQLHKSSFFVTVACDVTLLSTM